MGRREGGETGKGRWRDREGESSLDMWSDTELQR